MSHPEIWARQFNTLVKDTSAELFRIAVRILGSTAAAEDALQEAYLRAYEALVDQRFLGGSSLKTWLHRIVVNAALDSLRRSRREQPALLERPDPFQPAHGESRVALREMEDWVAGLPPPQRVALILKDLEGWTVPEIAHSLSCSEGAVEQRLVRARETLRNRRDEDGES